MARRRGAVSENWASDLSGGGAEASGGPTWPRCNCNCNRLACLTSPRRPMRRDAAGRGTSGRKGWLAEARMHSALGGGPVLRVVGTHTDLQRGCGLADGRTPMRGAAPPVGRWDTGTTGRRTRPCRGPPPWCPTVPPSHRPVRGSAGPDRADERLHAGGYSKVAFAKLYDRKIGRRKLSAPRRVGAAGGPGLASNPGADGAIGAREKLSSPGHNCRLGAGEIGEPCELRSLAPGCSVPVPRSTWPLPAPRW